MPRRKRTCFVIMPFGKKVVGDIEIDFDLIFEKYIRVAGEQAGYRTFRADTDKKGGLIIVDKLVTNLRNADFVVADVTCYNPNVYYELGIRHALCRHGTIVIRRKSGDFGLRKLKWRARYNPVPHPFDLQGLEISDYDLWKSTLARQIGLLKDRMDAAAAAATNTDSPVFHHLPNLRVTLGARAAAGRQDRNYEIVGAPGKYIGYRSGDIANLTGSKAVDFWVNSENTLMQMARMYERSVSSTIRYRGALDPDPKSPGFQDTIADALKNKMGNRHSAEPGEVLVTTSGRLAETHGVKAILHAATVIGSPGRGFHPIPDPQLADTVGEVVKTTRQLIREGDAPLAGQSLIMPMFGTGQAGRDPAVVAGQLIAAAIETLSHDPEAKPGAPDLKLVLFSAFSEDDVALLRRLFDSFVADDELKPATKGHVA